MTHLFFLKDSLIEKSLEIDFPNEFVFLFEGRLSLISLNKLFTFSNLCVIKERFALVF